MLEQAGLTVKSTWIKKMPLRPITGSARQTGKAHLCKLYLEKVLGGGSSGPGYVLSIRELFIKVGSISPKPLGSLPLASAGLEQHISRH